MEIINPTHNAPMLRPSSPTKRFLHSRSLSISPTRAYSPLGFDPLLRSLSPTSTLQAFTTSSPSCPESRSPSPRRLTLDASFKNVSEAQKELGCKAAQACLDIRGWTHELEGWDWPGCFEEPEPARKRARFSVMSIGSLASRETTEDEEKEEFWGSLPAVVVQEYDERAREISMQLDDIDLEELKQYTLQAHTSPDSTPRLLQTDDDDDVDDASSSNSPDLRQLDDFTAIVTATILQTLPFVNRLVRLLDDWSARIEILKGIPSFLRDIDHLRTDLDHGWAAVAVSLRKNGMYAPLGSENMQEMQALIDSSMTSLGQRLDSFLDLLEGRQDTVPEDFLDKFEELEERYAEWVVMAQRRVLGDELKEYQAERPPSITTLPNERISTDRAKTPTLLEHTFVEQPRKSTEPISRARTPTLLPGVDFVERAKTPTLYSTSDVVTRAVTPALDDAASAAPPASDDMELGEVMDNSEKSQEDNEPSKIGTRASDMPPIPTALPRLTAIEIPKPKPSASHSTNSREASPTHSGRPLPADIRLGGVPSLYQQSPADSAADLHTKRGDDVPLPTRVSGDGKPNARRAATPTDAIVTLPVSRQKSSKSPVRQASSALARLFKREKKQDTARERSRSTTSDSNSIYTSRRSVSRKRADTVAWGGRPASPSSLSQRPTTSSTTTDKNSLGRASQQVERQSSQDGRHLIQHERHSVQMERNPTQIELQNSQLERNVTQSDRGRAMHKHEKILNKIHPAVPVPPVGPQRSKTVIETTDVSRPMTYQPKQLDELSTKLKDPDFPEDWPLMPSATRTSIANGSHVELPADGLYAAITRDSMASSSSGLYLRTVQSMAAMGSDDFDKMFIDEFPLVPSEPDRSGFITFDLDHTQSDNATEALTPDEAASIAGTGEDVSVLTATPPSTHHHSVPTVTPSMLSNDGRQDDLSVARAISIDGLRQFDHHPLLPGHNLKERRTDMMGDERTSSLPLADDPIDANDTILPSRNAVQPRDVDGGSSQAVQGIGAFAAIAALKAAGTTTTQHNSYTEHDNSDIAGLAAVQAMMMHAQQSEYPPPLPVMPEDMDVTTPDCEVSPQAPRTLKRASIASIRAHAASEVRSIDVPARKGSSNKLNGTQQASEHSTAASEIAPEPEKGSPSYFQKPAYSRRGSYCNAQSPTGSIDTPNFSRLRSSSVDTNDQRPPLNATISKKRRTAPVLETIQPSAEYDADTIAASTNSRPVKRAVIVDEFDRHVSEVLEKIPASIRFKARGSDASTASSPGPRVSEVKLQHIRPKHSLMPRQSSGSDALTLTPAEASPKKSSSEESGIKLYHLTQAGREDPIKLFIRLVGENDRVMVRVGGGWADLADYLKRYAEHHGSRTVSGSEVGFELQSAGITPAGSRRASGAATTSATERKPFRDVDGSPLLASTGMVSRDESSPSVEGRVELPGSDIDATLRSVASKLQARPSSAHGRAKSALSNRNSNADLRKQKADDAASDHKARWVKTMLEKARKETSGAKNRKDNAFEDMGRIGATRRVIFRSSTAMDNRTSK